MMKSMFMRYAVSLAVIAMLYLGGLYLGLTQAEALLPVALAMILAAMRGPFSVAALVGVALLVAMFFASVVGMIAVIASGSPHKWLFASLAIAALAFGFAALALSSAVAKELSLSPGEVIVPSFAHGMLGGAVIIYGHLLLA